MLKKSFAVLALCASFLSLNAENANYRVIPLPQSIEVAKGQPFILSASTPIVYEGDNADMKRNAQFLSDYIKEVSGLKLNVVSRKDKKQASVVLVLDSKIQGAESYKIAVSNKQVLISGSTSAGVFYGLQTLRKSLPIQKEALDVTLPAVTINDTPRFSYRGMMLDCARHFFPVSFVKKYIDIMALHNLNTFHWHLTDDQGWRIEIKKYPRLASISSKRSGTVVTRNSTLDDSVAYGGYYTQEEAREIVRYAKERNITVIPEIDMPGHMKAALAAYPELGCTGGPYEVAHRWGVSPDVLCLGNEKTFTFLQDIIDEICNIFPSEYIHIGGDETPTVRWEKCPKDKALAERLGVDTKHIQPYFTNRMEKYINGKGRRLIGWDELLGEDGQDESLKVNKSATIMSWRGEGPGFKAAKLGHDVIMTPNKFAYFDYYQTDKITNEPYAIGGHVSVEKAYSFDPAPATFTDEERAHIRGYQANLWTEYIAVPTHAEYMVLPRMAAISEVGWLPTEKKNYEDFRSRIDHLAKIYDLYGYTYAKLLWPELYKKLVHAEP